MDVDTLVEFYLETLEPLETTPGTSDDSTRSTPDQSPSTPDNLSTNNTESDIESDESGVEFFSVKIDVFFN